MKGKGKVKVPERVWLYHHHKNGYLSMGFDFKPPVRDENDPYKGPFEYRLVKPTQRRKRRTER